MVTGQVPDMSNLIPFYAEGRALIYDEEQQGRNNKFAEKSVKVRFLGYPLSSPNNGFIVLYPDRRVMIRRDVQFDEHLPTPVSVTEIEKPPVDAPDADSDGEPAVSADAPENPSDFQEEEPAEVISPSAPTQARPTTIKVRKVSISKQLEKQPRNTKQPKAKATTKPRRSTRDRSIPKYLYDYVMHANTKGPDDDSIVDY